MDHAQQVNEPNGQDPLSHKTLILLYPINVFTIKIEDTNQTRGDFDRSTVLIKIIF